MRALMKIFPLLAAFGLASCGGGGGGSQSAFSPTPSDTIIITPAATSVPANSFTTLTVTVKKADGSFENDGTLVNASVSPTTVGTISGSGSAASTASNTLSGGKTSFNFNSSSQGGTATISISVPAGTNGSTTVAVATQTISVSGGNGQDPRLQIAATTTTLPVSPYTFAQQQVTPFPGNFLGSPYVTEVSLTFRRSNGQLFSGGTANVSIAPTSIAGLSVGTGTTATDLQTIVGSASVPIVGGTATVFVHAGNTPGTAVLTASAADPDGGQTITSQLTFTVAGSGSTLASAITVSAGGAIYVSNSGGAQSTLISATVHNGDNALVADPNGFNNVQFQIVGPAGSDARLSGVNAAGQTAIGTSVSVATHNGIAVVTLLAGTQQGPVQVKATADRGDNNVDNGIQDPVSATTTVVISDGKLFSLTLTTPNVNAILVNRVSTDATLINQGGGTVTIPPDPNATYALTVTALAVDREGNPVIPGTVIKFGSIDAPQTNGFFSISGIHGNPQEGGTLFTATDGHFRTAGGGAGPGDTLLVFGKGVEGNSDLESAVKVSTVNSETSLTVGTPFNLNDTTGTGVDYGFVLPYIVGRAQTGNITSPASTNAFGVASTTLNYPVSALGRAVAIWAQSNSTDTVTNQTNVVTDAEVLVFPGVAPAKITISPNPIPGNVGISVDACITDALDSPLSGVRFTFSFSNMGIGVGKLDGITGAGLVPDLTDASGCVTTTVSTTGIAANTGTADGPKLTFSVGAATASAPIVASGALVLIAKPSELGGNGGTVTLQLLNGNSTPVPGVQIVGTCTGDPSIGLSTPPGITDANGKTTTEIIARLNTVNAAGGSGSCTFTTSTGSPTVEVKLKGQDECTLNVSPIPIGCPNGGQFTLTINLVGGPGGGFGSVSSTPTSDINTANCQMPNATTPTSCAALFPTSSSVVVTAAFSAPTTGVTWSGAGCAQVGSNNYTTVLITSNRTCTVTFKP